MAKKPTYDELANRVKALEKNIHNKREPEIDPAKIDFKKVIDIESIQLLMDDFYSLTGIGAVIFDNNGGILAATRLQEVCLQCHRVHPGSAQNCLEKDLESFKGIEPGKFKLYKCKNNLWKMVTPIFAGKQKIGNLVLGQFLFEGESEEKEDFIRQDGKYGFDKETYLAVLENVPRWTRQKIKKAADFYMRLADLISSLSYNNVMLRQVNRDKESLLKRLEKEAQDKLIESEAKLHQAQKLETIGTLAGGIAHDFNNILFPVIVLTELLLEKNLSVKIKEDLNSILKAGKRARELVSQILTFSRKTQNRLERIELHPLLKEIIKLSRSTLPANIKINQHIKPDCGYAMIDVVQFQQIAMNLISNAFHAMENSDGILSLSLFNEKKPNKEGRIKTYICLKIADTGVGMKKETMEKIFEPYFSTKEQNKGSGLGLAVTNSIINSFGGEITVESEVGKGSSFCVYLPLADKKNQKKPRKNAKMLDGRQKNILIVDDEKIITRLLEKILKRSGFKTDVFTDSLKAFEFFKQSPEKFHLIISDLTMPDMNGDLFCQEISKIRSDIPIILMTGYKESSIVEKQKEYGIDKILIKPLEKNEILSAISDLIR